MQSTPDSVQTFRSRNPAKACRARSFQRFLERGGIDMLASLTVRLCLSVLEWPAVQRRLASMGPTGLQLLGYGIWHGALIALLWVTDAVLVVSRRIVLGPDSCLSRRARSA